MSAWMDLLTAFAIVSLCSIATAREITAIRRVATQYERSIRSLIRFNPESCNDQELRIGSTPLRITTCATTQHRYIDSISYAEKR